jgi:hypothetical protein
MWVARYWIEAVCDEVQFEEARSVQECRLVDRRLRLRVAGAGPGVSVTANATVTVAGTFLIRMPKREAKGVSGSEITCTGLDRHGDPPL